MGKDKNITADIASSSILLQWLLFLEKTRWDTADCEWRFIIWIDFWCGVVSLLSTARLCPPKYR